MNQLGFPGLDVRMRSNDPRVEGRLLEGYAAVPERNVYWKDTQV